MLFRSQDAQESNRSNTLFDLASRLCGPELSDGLLVIVATKIASIKLAPRGAREERSRSENQKSEYPNRGWIYLLGCKNTNAPANYDNVPRIDSGVEGRDECDIRGINVRGRGA